MEHKFQNKVLKLALPITAQQFMLALVSACDAFMLGGLNQSSLSAHRRNFPGRRRYKIWIKV